MTNIWLYPGAVSPSNVILSDPTIQRTAGGSATVIPSGVQATATVGSSSAIGDALVIPTGIQATASIGSPLGSGSAVASASGIEVISALGAVTASGGSVVNGTATPSGIQATSSVGALSAVGDANVSVSGIQSVSTLGTITAIGSANASANGVEATANVGTATANGGSAVDGTALPDGVEATSAIGDAVVSAPGTDQTQWGGGGVNPKLGSTAGAGLRVPYHHEKPVDEFGYEIHEPLVSSTPMAQPSAPRKPPIAAGPTELDLAIAPPYREPVAVARALPMLQVKSGPTPDEVLKAKHNHALRLLLLAS